jgi:predicted metal-dependent peptidase
MQVAKEKAMQTTEAKPEVILGRRSPELTEALSNLINKQSFFASYLFDLMQIQESYDIPTAATDGVRLIVNPDFFKTLTVPQRVFVLAHEVLHGILQHMSRSKLYKDRGIGPDFKPWNHQRANVAMDYIINDMLKEAGVGSLPPSVLHDTNIATQDDIWDEIYPKVPEPPEGDSGGHGGFDDHLDPDPGTPQPSDQDVKRGIASARQAAKARGDMPGNIDRMMGEILEPKLSWKELLRSAITNALGYDESTWSRPSRRRLAIAPHVYMPGTTGLSSGSVAIVIDTSGSISPEELNLFMSEVAGILDDARPQECFVYWTDSKVAGVDEVKDPMELEELSPKGGGGTNMPAAYPVIAEHQYTDDLTCVVLTDGYTQWDEEPAFPVIIVTTGKTGAPYGEEILMEEAA